VSDVDLDIHEMISGAYGPRRSGRLALIDSREVSRRLKQMRGSAKKRPKTKVKSPKRKLEEQMVKEREARLAERAPEGFVWMVSADGDYYLARYSGR
jgi:hypothetical protein